MHDCISIQGRKGIKMKATVIFAALILAALALVGPAMAGSDSIYGIHFWGTSAGSMMNGRAGYDVETTWVQNKTDWSDIRTKCQNARNEGFTVIVRFNWAGGYTVPGLNDWTGRVNFANKCREGVQALGDLCNIWIIGNEMNMAGEGGIPADWYLKCFNLYDSNCCYTQIHNVQSNAIVCIGAVAPNNADTNATGPYNNTSEKWKNYWYYLVNNSGLAVDGFAVHAYGGRQNGQAGVTGYDADARDDQNLPYGATADNVDVCWGFNSFRYFVDEVATKIGDLQRPIYITETNTGQTADPSTSYQTGWMQTAYESIDTWNKTHYQKVKTLTWFVYEPAGAWTNYALLNGNGNCGQARTDYNSMTNTDMLNTSNTPDAYIYNLNTGSSNLSSSDPNQVVLGSYVGRYAGYQGSTVDWGSGGPLGTGDNWVMIQMRHFYASSDGTYNFQTTSDDGSFLWVDGKLVVNNYGLHGSTTVSGSMSLTTGYHTVFVKFFESGGGSVTGYQYQPPGQGWQNIPDSHPLKGNATVYHLNAGASSLNSTDMTQIIPGSYVGSFGWNGVQKIYGTHKGPLSQTDDWLIMQGGLIWIKADGTYTFKTGSCDGSWIWIDGQTVVNNYGTGPLTWATGTKSLTRGWHMIFFKGFYHNTNSSASMCYEEQPSGTTQIDPIPIY